MEDSDDELVLRRRMRRRKPYRQKLDISGGEARQSSHLSSGGKVYDISSVLDHDSVKTALKSRLSPTTSRSKERLPHNHKDDIENELAAYFSSMPKKLPTPKGQPQSKDQSTPNDRLNSKNQPSPEDLPICDTETPDRPTCSSNRKIANQLASTSANSSSRAYTPCESYRNTAMRTFPVNCDSQQSSVEPSNDPIKDSPVTDVWIDDDQESDTDDCSEEKPRFSHTPEGAKVPLILSPRGESPVVKVPGPINQYLRDYQREGIQFLYRHYKENTGAILGDDMGLGKTVQVIGFLAALLSKRGTKLDALRLRPAFIRQMSDTVSVKEESGQRRPFLIIGPGCVLYNWIEELETWGYFAVGRFHGAEKPECLRQLKRSKYEIVVTTFETYRDHQESLNEIPWAAVIVDEVHKIKDLKAQTTKALRKINTSRRFGLTGTALQNNLAEFYSLLDWAQPDCLGTKSEFERLYIKPIELAQKHDANKRELAYGRKQQEKLSAIRRGMMIRRVKSLIADQLPRKDDSVVFCRLSALQTSIYQTILDHEYMNLVLHMDDPCQCDSGLPQGQCCKKKSPTGQSIKSLMFTLMHLLLKTSNHVAMLVPRQEMTEKQAHAARDVCKVAFEKHPEFMEQTKVASFKTLSDPKYCGKMKVLQGLLRVFSKEHSKVLVFSYSTQVLDIIERHIMATGYEFRRIDGTVSSRKRMVIVREFNSDQNIFICLISTKAGGLGLNLTGANRVVIFDPNWNPTHDLQAQDRAYRLGQRRNVQVFRLITTGTIEENMYLRQIYKQQLLNVTVEDANARRYFYAVQGNRRQKGEIFGIRNMFSLRTGDACFTRDILKRTERVESALGGFEMAQYVPPVVRVEESDDSDDEADVSHRSADDSVEDWFKEFFSDDSDVEDPDMLDDGSSRKRKMKPFTKHKNPLTVQQVSSSDGRNKRRRSHEISEDEEDVPDNLDEELDVDTKTKAEASSRTPLKTSGLKKACTDNLGKKTKVRFQEAPKRGKVKPEDSRTGKGPIRGQVVTAPRSDEGRYQVDQTLAGTFTDVSDVFDECGVVHIHQNRKVVGGSRAEDHMTRCAIQDVFENRQNSQELAVQCEPMSESSGDEEEPVFVKAGRGKTQAAPDHNTPRHVMAGNTKLLIGQTPKTIKLKQMEDLAKFHSQSGTLLQFAELVLSSSLQDRMQMLREFYTSREPNLGEKINMELFPEEAGLYDTSGGKARKSAGGSTKTKSELRARKKSRTRPKDTRVSYMDDEDNDSDPNEKHETFMKHKDSNPNRGSGELQVGRKITPRKRAEREMKRSPYRKWKKSQTLHVPSKYLDEEESDSGSEDGSEDTPNSYEFRGKAKHTENSSEDHAKLLHELAVESGELTDHEDSSRNDLTRKSAQFDYKGNVGNSFVSSDLKRSKRKRTIERLSSGKYEKEAEVDRGALSLLDELFEGSSGRDSKPPPKHCPTDVAGKRKSPVKPVSHNAKSPVKRVPNVSDNTEGYSVLDEVLDVFSEQGESTNTSADDEEPVHLETSTLINENYDCFDDPRLWRKRKRKAPDKKSLVDRMIADSEADFDRMLTSGKLKKRRPKKSTSESEKSVISVDPSLSLFD